MLTAAMPPRSQRHQWSILGFVRGTSSPERCFFADSTVSHLCHIGSRTPDRTMGNASRKRL